MKSFNHFAVLGMLPFVAGCALITEEAVVAGAATSSMEASSVYDGVEADGINTLKSAVKDGGVTGFIGNEDGTVSEVLVRISADGETAYLSVDGGEEIEFPTKNYSHEHINGGYGQWSNGTDTIYVNYHGDGMDYVGDNSDNGFRGRIGLETPADSLPTGTATYTGWWNAESAGNHYEEGHIYANGQINLDADFDTGGIEGMTIGNYGGDGTSGIFAGTIDGMISGSRIAGTAFVEGPDVTGEFDMLGGIFGQTGDQMGGGIAGTLTDETGDHALGGNFYLNIDNGERGCCFD